MKLLNVITTDDLPKRGKRGYTVENNQKGTVARSKRAHHSPKATIAPPAQVALFGMSWALWRRRWLKIIAYTWKYVMTSDDRDWWTSEAATVAFPNYKNVLATRTGFQFFMWYQFRCFCVNLTRYIPFPANAADFPFQYTPPWAPPTIANPTIVDATAPGDIHIDCMNVAPDGSPALPVSWFRLSPPIVGTIPIGKHPWFTTSSTQSGTHSSYYYDLRVPFPKIRKGRQSSLVHCYAVTPTSLTACTASAATSVGSPPLVPWMNLDWGTTCDNRGTSVDWSTGLNTQQLQCSDYPFPTLTPPILGIRLRIRRWAFASQVHDTNVQLMKAGSPVGTNKAAAGNWSQIGFENKDYGGPTDTWGITWDAADIADPGFGAALDATSVTPSGGAYIDCMTITVWTPGTKYQFTTPTLTPFEWS